MAYLQDWCVVLKEIVFTTILFPKLVYKMLKLVQDRLRYPRVCHPLYIVKYLLILLSINNKQFC